MDEGVVLSTGVATDLVNGNPSSNTSDRTGTEFNASTETDSDLGAGVRDKVKLNFNVTPQYDTLIIDFMFGSEEYTEYVDGGYNDKMRILVDGADCALTPDGQVFSIDAVNTVDNAPLFNNNDIYDSTPGTTYNTEMDGFTRVLSCRVTVTPSVSIPMVIGVSDDGDADYDSWAFFRAQSLRSEPSGDYGDAPDSYGTLLTSSGPRHLVVEGVYIGTKPTGDSDGFVDGTDDSGGTAGDDSNDDGVSSFPLLTDVTTTYSLTVSATSINGSASNLIGWIDFDGDGVFQSDEASNVASVSSGSFESNTTLTWNNIGGSGPDIALGDTFVRLRITNSAITSSNTGGYFASGEVEDHPISVTDGVPPVVATTSAPTATVANQTTYPVSGTCTVGDGNVTVSIAGATPASQGVACSGAGTWSASFDVSAIGDGTNVIDVNASQTDAASNTGNATLVEADKDATAPSVATTSAPIANLANAATYPVSGTCTAGDGDVTVSIAGATPASQAVACSGGGAWSASFNVSAIGDGTDVIDVNASQTDAVGNTGNATLVESDKDTVAPLVATTSAPTANASNQASYPVSGTCTAGDGSVTVGIAGATPASQAVACSGGGTWTTSFNVSAIGNGTDVIDVSASQTDTAGNTGTATLVEADKDATAPSVATTSAPTATSANEASYPVSGTCSAGDGDVTVGIVGATPASQAVACSGGGTWSASFNVSAIGDGTNVIDVNASQTDAAGNTGNATLVEADKDATAPSVATTSAPTAASANQASYPVSGTCSAGDGNVTVSIAGATPASQAVACSGGGAWSASFDVSAIGDGTDVIDVSASQTDAVGNTGNATLVEADKDTTAPSVATTSAPIASSANQASYPVSGTCSVGDGDVTVSIAGATPASQAVTCSGGGAWSASFDVTAIGDGTDVIDVNASQTDAAGNTGNATLVEADKDATAPSVATTSAPTATIANQANYPVSGTCSAGDGNVTVSIAGATPASQAVACSGGGTWSASFNVSAISDGTNVIDVNASQTDAVGNTGNATLVEADKDATAPTVAITSAPTAGSANQASYPVSGTCTAGDGNVTVNITGATPASQAVACSGGGTWSASFNVSAIGDGTNVIDVTASQTDGLGNSGNATLVEADKDTVGPSVAILNAPSAVADLTPYTVTFEFSDDVSGFASGDVTLGNASLSNFTPVDGNTYTADVTPNGGGDITIDVSGSVALDLLGNANLAATQATTVLSPDSDGDGIPDIVECPSGPPFDAPTCAGHDTDGDTTPDYLDTDSDQDGIPDSVEAGSDPNNPVDTDGDGDADYQDTDSDGDAIPDSVEAGSDPANPVDTDGDGNEDYIDLDADNDNIPDSVEAGADPNNPVDTDGDGTEDYIDLDSENDGIPDAVEGAGSGVDTDSDGIDDAYDVDQTGGADLNGDGIDDDAAPDTDGDGTVDFRDPDADGDGIPDSVEAGADPNNPVNTDGDGNADFLDTDSDNDGVSDTAESGASGNDTDADGIDDAFDVDQTGGVDLDNDGVDDAVAATDSNGDGTPDYRDNTDSDGDGLVNTLDIDDDNDGILDTAEGSEAVDTDGDGIADSLDLDSDNDGLFDLVESGAAVVGLDADSDGRIDGGIALGGNGYADLLETSVDSGSANYTLSDSDSDSVRDFRDLDSDGDGLYDLVEAGGTDGDDNGRIDGLSDLDSDGLHDALAGSGLPDPDTDSDGVVDVLDLDSDNDGIYDVTEAGGSDGDGDGLLGNSPQTVNADGVATGSGLSQTDSDGDGVVDRLDLDSDNDGIPDVTEAGGSDPDGDGRVGTGAPTVDASGVTDSPILPGNADGDSLPNHLDLDSDGDGLLDIVEGGGTDTNADGRVDGLSDGNGDGLDDLIASSPLPLPDADADTLPDFLDNDDQDNDGVPDSVDQDLDNDGIPNDLEGNGSVDTDGDGIPDSADLDSDNDGLFDIDESGADADALDTDDDGRIDNSESVGANGIADTVETAVDSGSINYNGGNLLDTDSDGVDDFRDLDSDNDGLYDVTETGGSDPDADGVLGSGTPTVNPDGMAPGSGQPAPDTDGDGVDDHNDVDSDNDGVSDVVEAGGSDPDNDGVVGSGTPSVDPNTGVSLVGGGLLAADEDGDGTPNHQDTDSDNDGASDLAESGSGAVDSAPQDGVIDAVTDTNNNGWDDGLEGLVYTLPDGDGDGTPDIWDDTVGSDQPLQTGLSGVGGCSVGSGKAFDPLLPLLALFSLIYLGKYRRRRVAIRVK